MSHFDHRAARAYLIGRWGKFFRWIHQHPGFESESLVASIDDASHIHSEPGFCPIHGGDSGEAWRFFDDANISGGSVCNTCGSFSDGLKMLTQMHGEEQALTFARQFVSDLELNPLSELSVRRLNEWFLSFDQSIVVRYLRNRGIKIREQDLPEALRGRKRFPVRALEKNLGEHPTVMALIKSRDDQPITYHAIYLNSRCKPADYMPKNKRGVQMKNKMTRGVGEKRALSGAYVDLGSIDGQTLILGEGVETLLAVRQPFAAEGLFPMIRATVGGGIHSQLSLDIPSHVKRVIFALDKDMLRPFLKAMEDGKGRVFETDVQIGYAVPDGEADKSDWLDIYNEAGEKAVFDAIKNYHVIDRAAVDIRRNRNEYSSHDSKMSAAARKIMEGVATGEDEPGADLQASVEVADGRPVLVRGKKHPSEEYRVLDAAITLDPPKTWFRYNHALVEISGGDMRYLDVANSGIAAAMDERVNYVSKNGKNVLYGMLPNELIRRWWSRSELNQRLKNILPETQGVIRRPTPIAELRDGNMRLRMLTENGLDESSRYIVAIPPEEHALWHSEAVSRKSAALAAHRLHEELFSDFRFDTDADRANTFAALFTPLLAEAVGGNVPMIMVDAPDPGSGKTTLARTLSLPWGGAQDLEYSHNDEELSKRLATAFRQNSPLILLDNLTGRVNSDNLKRLITSPKETGLRLLGGNNVIHPPPGLVLYGTANNPEIQEEVMRRILPIRLNARMENPASRGDFKRKDLVEWVRSNQAPLRSLLYSIFASWIQHGAPIVGAPVNFTGFARWADICYSLMLFCGFDFANEFLANRERRLRGSDPEREEARAFIEAWAKHLGVEKVTSHLELTRLAERHKLPAEVAALPSDVKRAKAMLSWLNNHVDRVYSGWTIVRHEKRAARARHPFKLTPA